MGKDFVQMKTNKKANVPILMSNNIDLKAMPRDKEGHYIMLKVSIQRGYNIYALNVGANIDRCNGRDWQ